PRPRRERRVEMSSKFRKPALSPIFAAAVAALGGTAAYGQTTQPVTWVGTTGDHNTAANWSHNQTPANANREFLQVNNGGTVTYSDPTNYEGAWMRLGMRPGETGHMEINGGTLTLGELRVGGRETIANDLTDWQAS